jgi:hypothetical protein
MPRTTLSAEAYETLHSKVSATGSTVDRVVLAGVLALDEIPAMRTDMQTFFPTATEGLDTLRAELERAEVGLRDLVELLGVTEGHYEPETIGEMVAHVTEGVRLLLAESARVVEQRRRPEEDGDDNHGEHSAAAPKGDSKSVWDWLRHPAV